MVSNLNIKLEDKSKKQLVFGFDIGAIFIRLKSLLKLTLPLLLLKINVPVRGFFITWIFSYLYKTEATAGIIIFTLFTSITTFFIGVLISSVGVVISYSIGGQKYKDLSYVISQGIWLSLLLSIVAMALYLNIDKIFLSIGQPRELITSSQKFCNGLAWVFFPYAFIIIATKLLTNLYLTRMIVNFSVLGLVACCMASYLFVFDKLELPISGLEGIGWGLAFGYWLQALTMLIYLLVNKQTRKFLSFNKPSINYIYKMWRLGWPIGIKYNIEFFAFFLLSLLLSNSISSDLIVYQCILQFFLLTSCLAGGVGLAASALIGQAIGQQKFVEAKKNGFAAILLTIFFVFIVSIFLLLFSKKIAILYFGYDSENFHLFIALLPLIITFQFIDSIKKILSDILVVFKKAKAPLVAEFVSLWGIGMPLSYLFIHELKMGLCVGLLLLVISALISCSLLFYIYIQRINKC